MGMPGEHLELATILKASHAVSGEIVLEKLIQTVLALAVEHAGAERALLLLQRGQKLQAEAEARTSSSGIAIDFPGRRPDASELPEPVLQHVLRTRESVVLNEALPQSVFNAAYIGEKRIRSLLCLPLLVRGNILGVLYLESTVTGHAFTPERVEVLKRVTEQAAISLENARLYADLRASEDRLRLAINAIPAMVWVHSADGVSEFINDRWQEHTGLPPEAASGARWHSVIHPDDLAGILRARKASLLSGEPFSYEARIRRYDGEYRWFLHRALPLRDARGNIIQWYGANTDIEDRKQTEEALRVTEARLSRAMQIAMGAELAAAIAHEVNQPLTALVANGYAALRWLSADPPNLLKVRQSIESIVREGKEAGEVVRRTRALFQGDRAAKIPLDINRVIADVLRILHAETVKRHILVDTDLEAALPRALAEPAQIQQLLLNLLVNGMEAMDGLPDQPRKLAVRSRREDPESIAVEIRDWGAGIKEPSKVFEAFFTTKESGMGMGLAICRSIIEAHHGRLWVEPPEGPGAIFCFTLPVAPGPQP